MLNKKMIVAILLSNYSCASHALFCPSNFSVINMGDSIESVKQLCGKPSSEKTKEEPKPVPQEWAYYIQQAMLPGTSTQAASQAAGTFKISFSFDKEGKVVSITANGLGVGATPICGTPIQLGATRDQVKTACGEPGFVNMQNSETSGDAFSDKSDKITTTEYTYTSTPPVTLIFTNGKLTGTK